MSTSFALALHLIVLLALAYLIGRAYRLCLVVGDPAPLETGRRIAALVLGFLAYGAASLAGLGLQQADGQTATLLAAAAGLATGVLCLGPDAAAARQTPARLALLGLAAALGGETYLAAVGAPMPTLLPAVAFALGLIAPPVLGLRPPAPERTEGA